MGCYVLLVIIIIFLWWWLRRENRRKDELLARQAEGTTDTGLVHAFEDLTDRENLRFRYIY